MFVLTLLLTLAACGGGGGGGGGTTESGNSGSQITLSGTITFDFVSHNVATSGLDYGSTTVRPARGIQVQALSAGNSLLASAITDANGLYSVTAPANSDVRIRARAVYAANGAASWNFSVNDNTNGNALYVMQGSLVNTGNTDSVRDLHAASGWTGSEYTQARTAAPFAILDTVYESMQKLLAVDSNVVLPAAQLRWSINNTTAVGALEDGEIGTSFFDILNGDIYLLGAADNDSDEYDRHVVAHEWCHYFEFTQSRSDNFGGPHGLGDRLDMRVAFSEGFCNALAALAVEASVYRDSLGDDQSSGFSFDLEDNVSFVNKGWYNEDSVGAIVYDILDPVNDGLDTISNGLASVYTVLTSAAYLNADAVTSIHLLLAELKSRFAILAPGINSLAGQQSITVNDALGTGETNDAGVASTLPLYQEVIVGGAAEIVCSINDFGVFNKLGNSPLIRFTAASSRNYTVTVARVSGSLSSNPDLIIWQHSNFIDWGGSAVPNSETWVGPLPAGTYVMEVYERENIATETGFDVCFSVAIN